MKNIIAIIISILALSGVLSCSDTNKRLLRIQENGKYGFIDTLGNIVIDPQYKYVGGFTNDGYALVITKASIENDTLSLTYGYIDINNKFVVDTTNLLRVSIPDLSALWHINYAKDFVAKFDVDSLEFLTSCFASLRLSQGFYQYTDSNNLIGYKDLKGNIRIPAKYKYAGAFYNDVAFVSEGLSLDEDSIVNFNCISLINSKGEYLKEKAWAYVPNEFLDGHTWCAELDIDKTDLNKIPTMVWTQIDETGKTTIGPINANVGSQIYNGYRNNDAELYLFHFPDMLGLDMGYSYINKNGKYATDKNNDNMIVTWACGEDAEVLDDATSFSEGLAGIKVYVDGESRWTFMTPNLEVATYELYDSVKPFTDGLAVVQQLNTSYKHLGNWGVIDRNFNLIIPYKFSEISQFSVDGFAYARISSSKYDREGWINRKGEFIWETNRQK
jgi:hypothetical protein